MNPFQRFLVVCIPSLFLTLGAPYAQERSAGMGDVEPHLDWSKLSQQVKAAVATSDNTAAKVEGVVACNRQAKLYVGTGLPSDGCIENSEIGRLSAKVDAINVQIIAFNSTLVTINSNLTNGETQIPLIQGAVDALNPQVGDLLTQYSDLSSRAAVVISQIDNLNSSLNGFSARISTLSSQFANHTLQINELYAKLAALTTTMNSYSTAIANINAGVGNLNNSVSALNSNVGNILNCGQYGYVFNRNSGCTVPVSHAYCYFPSPSSPSIACN